MSEKLQVIGTPVSPFVRKALAVLALKGVAFEIDPVIAFYTDDEFLKLNPLRRIPVLIDGETTIADSSVIAAYLEDKFPSPSILPTTPEDRAKARWLDEYATSRMSDVFLWGCFNAVVIKPGVWNEERDIEAYHETLAGPVVEIMDYLETQAPGDDFLFADISLGDISVAVMFRNMRWSRWTPDEKRWPKTANWIKRCEAHPVLAQPIAWGDALMKVTPPAQRDTLIEIGAPVMERFLNVAAPRRGPMTRI